MTPFLNRRDALTRSGMGLGAIALADLLGRDLPSGRVAAATPSPTIASGAPDGFAGNVPIHFPATAKRVIHLFMNGGPSQVDTFDHKPALEQFDGKTAGIDNISTERPTGNVMRSPFRFEKYGQCGLAVSELFEKTAAHADDLCVIHSMHANVPNHEPSLLLMNTGEARLIRPAMGSWVTYGLGTANANLPAFVAMCPGGYPIKESQNWQNGFLPGKYQGTYVDPKKQTVDQLIENIRSRSVASSDQREQLDLLMKWNQAHAAARPSDPRLESRIESFELAYRMQSEASEAFDISLESKQTREMYGDTEFARGALIARRLVERDVRFVQLYTGAGQPWDSHDDIHLAHREVAGRVDQAIAALLSDLKRTGLLDETLVIWGGEFGRTPVVELPKEGANQGKMNGRDHNHYGFTMWMAGGGVNAGTTVGASDELGFKAVENRVHVHDLHATILHLLGYDHKRLTYPYAGRDFRLTDVHGRVIDEIIG